jgi:diguanylate cyclase (GGDEF)-like protein
MSLLRHRGRRPDDADGEGQPHLHDPLTKLPGRVLFQDRLERSLVRSVRRRSSCAVLSIDLDRFKLINDSFGQAIGDRMLIEAGVRLDGCLRPEDSVARTGSDEFMVLLETVRDTEEAITVAQRIAAALEPPVEIDGRELYLSASIGIAIGRGGRDRPEDVLQNAEVAVHRAKENGRATYEVFRQEMASHPVTRLDLESELRRAVAAEELYVAYQPEVELATGRIVAVEALLRWRHPERGAVEPSEFVPIAEETGLILPLGRRLIREACAQAAGWPEEIRLSVNLSARQLQQPQARLVDEVGSAVASSRLDPGRLCVEITEGAVLQDQEAALAAMRALERLGVKLAVDDFGTGYSSLTYLRRFPIDVVKIDRSFVSQVTTGREDEAIVHALVEVCHALHAAVLGEGIETGEQALKLRELGCELGQGLHFSPPVSADEIGAMLRNGKPLGLAPT